MIREIKNNKLYFDGCDTTALAEKYGTPLYVYSENDIIGRFEELRRDFIEKYPNTRVAYAAKAFFPLAMAKLVDQCGMCVDVVSGGELYTAIKEYGIGRIIVDSLQELSIIEEICREKNKKARILFRVTPGVKSSSHDYIVTGKKDSKFGIPLDDEIVLPQVKAAIDSPYIDFYGIHFHVGSQLFDNGSHLQATDIILKLAGKIKENFGYDLKEINVGGGFGVTYVDEERKSHSYFLDPIMEKIDAYYAQLGVQRPNVVIEPGRSIAAEAGITLYTVGSIKEIPGIRTYMSVDGGMTDNIRPALYQAVYTGVLANKAEEEKTEVLTVCGKCCESGDILIHDLKVAKPEAGDIFAVFSTGAYGYTMASNYNKNPIPGVVFVKDGADRLVVKPQTYDDIMKNEIL